MKPRATTKAVARSRRQFAPTFPPDLPPVEDLRTRAVLGRIRSPALAAVIAAHCFGVVEDGRACR